MINEVATVAVAILIYFFVTKTMKRLVSNVLENTYYVYSYKVQLVYNYTTEVPTSTLLHTYPEVEVLCTYFTYPLLLYYHSTFTVSIVVLH